MASDRAATVAYLEAQLTYERARVAAALVSRKAVEALGEKLGGECAGVVANAKRMQPALGAAHSPLQRGEAERWSRQWGDLTAELSRAIDLTRGRPYRQAALAFAGKVRTLKWSDAMVTAFTRPDAAFIEWEASGAVPPVCADLAAWASSDYTTLTAATKAYAAEREAAIAPAFRLISRLIEDPVGLLSNPLRRYEGVRAKRLSRRLAGVQKQERHGFGGLERAVVHVETALGVTSEAERKKSSTTLKLLKATLTSKAQPAIGKGRTAAGTSYVISVETGKHHNGSGGLFEAFNTSKRCRPAIQVREKETSTAGTLSALEGEPAVRCLSHMRVKAPRVRCEGERRTIDARTPAAAQAVSLNLANGRKLVSRVARVPRRLGGPAGFYHQAVFVWASPPVSLTESSADGRVLATVRLHVPKCVTRWPFTPPGSDRRLAGGSTPGGQGFSIVATSEVTTISRASSKRRRFSLRSEVSGQFGFGGAVRSDAGKPLAWQLRADCQPDEFAIVYGVLKDPHATVWARGPSGLRQLRRAHLPASPNQHGVLAYAALPAVPSELIVRGPGGNTLHAYSLSDTAREHDEICEGEAEPTP